VIDGQEFTYGGAIREGFRHLLANHPKVFAIGQGLWSPWYVGTSMTDLDVEFGAERVIDTPVSELACTGAAMGAAIAGYRPIVVHPRLDFMVLALDPIVNEAAKWTHMLGGGSGVPLTIRGIINRGGEQGAQHSQALHAWYAHIPGLRVVMPATVADARDLLISSVLCDDPVIYIDDRWLYDLVDVLPPVREERLIHETPVSRREGRDVTLVGAGFSADLCLRAANELGDRGVSVSVIDLRVINPLNVEEIIQSVELTGRLCVVDGGWSACGLAGEVISAVMERVPLDALLANPVRMTLPNAPAPTSSALEQNYYTSVEDVVSKVLQLTGSYTTALKNEKVV